MERRIIWAITVMVSLLGAIIGFSLTSASREAQGAAEGSLRWKFKTGDAITSSPAMSGDGTIYFGSKDDCVYAVSSSGEQVWKLQTGGDVTASPAIGEDGTVYVGSLDHYLYAINPDGSLKWKYKTAGEIDLSAAVAPGGVIYVSGYVYDKQKKVHKDILYALSPDGTLKWQYENGGANPVVGWDGTVYVVASDSDNPNKISAMNPDGTLKWKAEGLDKSFYALSSPAVGHDGRVYVTATADKEWTSYLYLIALDLDGTIAWKFEADSGYAVSSPAIAEDGTIYFGTGWGGSYAYLYAVQHEGRKKWIYKTDGDVKSSPAIGADGTIYLGSKDNYIHAIKPDGALKWRYRTSGPVRSSPTIAPDGTVYIGSDDTYMYAINSSSQGLQSSAWPRLRHDPRNTAYQSTRPLQPVADYPFNANAQDESGNGNNGAVFGATLTKDRYRKANKAYHFNGSDSFIEVGNGSTFNIDKAISLCAWLRFTVDPYSLTRSKSFVVDKGDAWSLWYSADGEGASEPDQFFFGIGSGSGVSTIDRTWEINKWYNICATYDGATAKIFVDGELSNSATFTKTIPLTADDVVIGAASNPQASGGWLVGDLDEIRVYDDTIPEWQVKEMFVGNDGMLKWEYGTDIMGPEMYCSPAIGADGTIYIANDDGFLNALTPDGKLLWQFAAQGVGYSSPAIGQDGTIYIGSEINVLYAVNPDGTWKWEYFSGGIIDSTPAIAENGTIYFISDDGFLQALSSDGSFKWKCSLNLTNGSYWRSPAVAANGTVYVASRGGLSALNPDGTLRWYTETPYDDELSSPYTPAIGADGTVYVGSGESLYALNPDGTVKWNYETWDIVYQSSAIAADGTIYAISERGGLCALNPDGTLKWRFPVEGDLGGVQTPTVGADGTVYVKSWGSLYALDRNGTLKWEYSTRGAWEYRGSSPSISRDGTLYVASDYKLYAISTNSMGLADSPWPMFQSNPKHTGRYMEQAAGCLTVTITPQAAVDAGAQWSLDQGDWQNSGATLCDLEEGNHPAQFKPVPGWEAPEDMIVLISSGDTRSITAQYLQVSGPVADFTGIPTTGSAPLTVAFTDESTGSVTSWSWTFGDGFSSTERNPTHIYTSGGSFTVTLTLTGTGGSDTETKTGYITVSDSAPAPDFEGSPTSGKAPLSVQFTDKSTGSVTSRAWSFGDGGTSTGQNPTHTYTSAGSYTVSLTVTGPGGSATKTRTDYITVSEAAPKANFTAAPKSGKAPLTVKFKDKSRNTVTSRLWSFGDGESSTEQNPSHTYTAAGTYTVSLTASGPGGSSTKTLANYITVTEPAPVAAFSANPTSGKAPLKVKLTDESTGRITKWSWSFGDGGAAKARNPVHTFKKAGAYTVKLTVTGPGGSSTKTKTKYIKVTR